MYYQFSKKKVEKKEEVFVMLDNEADRLVFRTIEDSKNELAINELTLKTNIPELEVKKSIFRLVEQHMISGRREMIGKGKFALPIYHYSVSTKC